MEPNDQYLCIVPARRRRIDQGLYHRPADRPGSLKRVGSGGVACPARGPSDPERRSSRRRWPPAAPSSFTCSSATAQGSSIPVTQEADQRSLTRATSSDDSPADQKARDLALQVGSLLPIFVVRVELFLALAVARLDQLGHERAA